jgi:hypothetical protein
MKKQDRKITQQAEEIKPEEKLNPAVLVPELL